MIKKISGRKNYFHFKIIVLLISVILIFQTGCIMGVDNNTQDDLIKQDTVTEQIDKNENEYEKHQDIVNNYYSDSYYKYVVFPEDNEKKLEVNNFIYYNDFESSILSAVATKNCYASTDVISQKRYENETRVPNILESKHGNVCILNGDKGKEAYYTISVNIEEKSILSFEFLTDIYYSDILKLKIDDSTYRIFHKGYGDSWKKKSIELMPGTHTITWYLPNIHSYAPKLLNKICIDNISIVKDQMETVEIYPKGLQETYVGGMNLKFYAVGKRADGSIIENQHVSYSVSGCGTIDNNGMFRPTGKGECTITATVNGKKAVKSDIVVHGKNYLSDEVKIGGYKFTGNYTLKSGEKLDTDNTKYNYPETPMSVNFDADGFFVLKGNTKCPLLIYVQKNETQYKTYYVVRNSGDFYKRVWLRFGPGKYIISIIEDPNMQFYNTGNPNYEGDLISTGGRASKVLYVNNTNPISEQNAMWLMPSEVVQSDSFYVSNVAHSILSSLPYNATTGDKLRAIHDWELYNHYYDMVSVNHQNQRKRQDAESVLKYHMGVCEGYANLYAALVRHAGIQTKVICEATKLMHAWNHVLYDNNQWYLVDVTWDDPVPPDAGDLYGSKIEDFGVGQENYTYFMTSHTDDNHTVAGIGDFSRSAIEINQDIPKMTGLPDGWY